MKVPLVFFFGLVTSAWARTVSDFNDSLYASGSCSLNVNNDLPKKNEPLLLARGQSGYSLVLPELQGRNGVITLREGQEIIIACPGNKNFIQATKQTANRAVCRSGSTLSINGRDQKSLVLDCNDRAQATTRVTQRNCANGKGVIVEIGFQVEGWTKLIESCHNLAQSSTYYSTHLIHGARLAAKVYRKTARPKFSRGGNPLFHGINPEAAYTQRNQVAALSQLLGGKGATLIDLKKSLFLSRGHLAPDADFLLSPHQFLTYFYVNVAPQWQSINAGNWLKIEDATRGIAKRLNADMEVVTGTLGVLRLSGQNGIKDITLQNSRIPVPEFFWKVLRNTQDNSCIVFIASNNPFLTQKPRHICQDICSVNRWPVLQNDFSRGYIYCCDYAQVRRAIPEMPNLPCRSTLRG